MPVHVLPETSRRRFLGAAVGATYSVLGGCADWPGGEGDWFAWCSDLHVAADERAKLNGQIMLDNVRAMVADVMSARDVPRGVIIDGDMALLDGQIGDYRTLTKTLRPIVNAGAPLHFALGNHDDRDHFHKALGVATEDSALGKHVACIEGEDVRMVLLDSLDRPNVTGGELGTGQLRWLAKTLDAVPKVPTIVFVHHHLNPHKQSALHDTNALMDVLRPRVQAKAIVFGHTHVWNIQQADGIYTINLPAVGYKFHRREPLGWCVFRPTPNGGELQLRCVGGERRHDRQRIRLRWRIA